MEGTAEAVSDREKGSGAYTLNERSEAVQNGKVLGPSRAQGMAETLWAFTVGEYERILGTSA